MSFVNFFVFCKTIFSITFMHLSLYLYIVSLHICIFLLIYNDNKSILYNIEGGIYDSNCKCKF